MDDITFRRTIYADPFTKDPAVIVAAKDDPKKKQFWDEVQQFETELQQAAKISVPDNLAEKLILRQTVDESRKEKARQPWYFGIAASVVLASVIAFSTIQSSPDAFADDVFAHVSDQYMQKELRNASLVDTTDVNAKLISFNGEVEDDFGDVLTANFCYLGPIKSLHMIIQGERGLVSLFVMHDDEEYNMDKNFSDATNTGVAFLMESARIIVIGKDEADVEEVRSKATSRMRFST